MKTARIAVSVVRQEVVFVKASTVDKACEKLAERYGKMVADEDDPVQSFVICSADEEG